MLWSLFRLQSGWSRQELGSPFLLCDMCQAYCGMGKRFTLYAFRHSYGLEKAHGPCFRLLLLLDQYNCLFWYFADRASQYIYLNINQLDALNFIMSLFHASTCFDHTCSSSGGHGTATYRCDDTRGSIVQFWPPDDEHLCSKHVEAWNKHIIKFSASSWLILR